MVFLDEIAENLGSHPITECLANLVLMIAKRGSLMMQHHHILSGRFGVTLGVHMFPAIDRPDGFPGSQALQKPGDRVLPFQKLWIRGFAVFHRGRRDWLLDMARINAVAEFVRDHHGNRKLAIVFQEKSVAETEGLILGGVIGIAEHETRDFPLLFTAEKHGRAIHTRKSDVLDLLDDLSFDLRICNRLLHLLNQKGSDLGEDLFPDLFSIVASVTMPTAFLWASFIAELKAPFRINS